MNAPFGLLPPAHDLICDVLRRHRAVVEARIFGSRAKGTHTPQSDVDIALFGELDDLAASEIEAELNELPLPVRFDAVRFSGIKNDALREHIERVGKNLFLRD